MGVYKLTAYWIYEVPDHKLQKICNEVVSIYPCLLEHVPDHLKTQEMREKAVKKHPSSLRYVPNYPKFWKIF